MKKLIITLIIIAVVGMAFYLIKNWYDTRLYRNPAFATGNGRIEATEINIAAKLAGKVEKIKVQEGDKVKQNDVLVVMQLNVLEADLAQAKAKLAQAKAEEISAKAVIGAKQATVESKKATVNKAEVDLRMTEIQYKRYKDLLSKDATTQQEFDKQETLWLGQKAQLASAKADLEEAIASVNTAKADAEAAKANILAAEADIKSIQADIDDSILKAPIDGRIQYRIAEPGEVLSAGGRAINMIDLTDVYMTFFLPEEECGKVQIGADARIVLDAVPEAPIPAKITYVASVAQFTPKTVETKIERQKLMFRLKAHIDPQMLVQVEDIMKTGLPGVVWVRLDANEPWPKQLQTLTEKGVIKSLDELKLNKNNPDAKDNTGLSKSKTKLNDEAQHPLLNEMQKEAKQAEEKKDAAK